MLKRVLYGVLSDKEIDELYSSFDQVGEIIIVRIPESLEPRKKLIGETLLKEIKPARSVFYQSSDVQGDFRTRDLELLAGINDTKTEYTESGCRFIVDVEKAFFSPRLSAERERIASLVSDDETVINMFGGIGMFSIIVAKRKTCRIYSIDVNPVATQLCRQNISRNKLAGTVIPINGDASKVIKDKLQNIGDRTLMLLPEKSDEFLQSAVDTTKNGGIIHYYSHVRAESRGLAGQLSEKHYLDVAPTASEIISSKVVRAIGPRYYQTVVDVKIRK